MPDYANGKIYKIVNSVNDKVYIGSTTQTLKKRMQAHCGAARLETLTSKLYVAMNKLGVDNFSVVLVKMAPCDGRKELQCIEYSVARKLQKQGARLYNCIMNGKHSNESILRMRGKTGSASPTFKRGSVYHKVNEWPSWVFSWLEDGNRRSISFGINKYGYDEAKQLAEEYRDKIYPID